MMVGERPFMTGIDVITDAIIEKHIHPTYKPTKTIFGHLIKGFTSTRLICRVCDNIDSTTRNDVISQYIT